MEMGHTISTSLFADHDYPSLCGHNATSLAGIALLNYASRITFK
jgi:hypothetical protein